MEKTDFGVVCPNKEMNKLYNHLTTHHLSSILNLDTFYKGSAAANKQLLLSELN